MTNNYHPTLEKINSLKDQGNLVPVFREIDAGNNTPVSAYLKVTRGPYSFLLESVEGTDQVARFSLIGTEPEEIFITGSGQQDGLVDPLFKIEKYMDQFNIGFTHLYNAMSGNDHRNPGVLTAALHNSQYAEIICDLHHVSEQAIKIAKKCIPGLYAITDSIGAAGLKDGNYTFANIEIEKKREKVTLKNSSTLAGSVASMHTNFLNLLNIQYTIEEAVSMTSYNASQYLKLDDVGLIKDCLLYTSPSPRDRG